MKIIHHDDLDGRCAAYVVYQAMVFEGGTDEDVGIIEIEHSLKFPLDQIEQNEIVWIVDYSIPPEEMEQLLEITGEVFWIDHHMSAIEQYEDFDFDLPGLRVDGIAACVLTYIYIYLMTQKSGEEVVPFSNDMEEYVPKFIRLVGDRDVWKFEFGDDAVHFFLGMQGQDDSPESGIWRKLYLESKDRTKQQKTQEGIIYNGEIIRPYKDNWAKDYIKKFAFVVEFEGYNCIALNLGRCGSEYFDSVEGEYDILISFAFNGDTYQISLYSETVNVAEIATKYGGGGHKGASGFEVDKLPFEAKEDKVNGEDAK